MLLKLMMVRELMGARRYTSLLMWPLGVQPFADNIWTMAHEPAEPYAIANDIFPPFFQNGQMVVWDVICN